ncbi:hypothetical protein GOODEAATRI_024825, partial [Goodea atripinnis]
ASQNSGCCFLLVASYMASPDPPGFHASRSQPDSYATLSSLTPHAKTVSALQRTASSAIKKTRPPSYI